MTVDGSDDRRELAKQQPAKPSRWPRTERRRTRIAQVVARRQPDLTVVLENVHDPHNVSAVLRSCDAVGVLNIHAVYSVEEPPAAFAQTTSASAAKWIGVQRHGSVAECYAQLRRQGLAIVATSVSPESADLYDIDLTHPIALVFGNEMRGISDEARDQADLLLAIPMMGMVQSLNISVACAVVLYEALRQRRLAGRYGQPSLDSETIDRLTNDWLGR